MRNITTLCGLILVTCSTALAETRTGARETAALPALPVAIASFGAAATADGLYVYGGHVGGTHEHSIENLSTGFWGLGLRDPEAGWRDLGPVRGLQGLAMVAHDGAVCRVGGMKALNHQDEEEEDLHSIAEVRCYHPKAAEWRALPPLTAGRSSHDAIVHDDRLYVVGGWRLRGKHQEPVWHETIEILDLESPEQGWRTVPQPFGRRALSVAALGGKVYAFGGIDREGTRRSVSIFDVESEAWSEGPELPRMAGPMRGFGVSAFAVGDVIYLSGSDGVIHRLEPETGWRQEIGKLGTARFFHRLVPLDGRLAFIAGASRSTHLASIEVLDEAPLRAAEAMAAAGGPEVHEAPAATSLWPGFRGRGDGHQEAAEPPTHWSDDSHLGWRARLPGFGQSAPVVWGSQVLATSVEGPEKETLILSSLDLETGEVRWRRRFEASQKIAASDMMSRGAPTPAVDADGVYAFWESGDLIALDHDGEVRWKRSLTREYGDFLGNHGVGSSPVLAGGLVIVQVTHGGPSYFVAIDKENGVNRWKVDRPEMVAWSTPVVVDTGDGTEIIASAAGRIEGLDASTGEQKWLFTAIEGNRVPSVAVDDRLVVAASSDVDQSLALPRGLAGEIDESGVAWRAEGVASGFGSPLIHGRCVVFVNKAGVASCVDRDSGETLWRHRLTDATWASPIAIGELAYFFAKDGHTTVLKPGPDGPVVVAENVLGLEGTVYAAAAAQGSFLIRSGTEIARVRNGPNARPAGERQAKPAAGSR